MKDKRKTNSKISYIILIVLLVLLLFLLAGVLVLYFRQYKAFEESNTLNSNHEYAHHFNMIVGDGNDEFWESVYTGAVEYAEKNDAYVELLVDGKKGSYGISELLEISIEAGVDGILVETDGSKEVEALINKAGENGIPVVNLLRDDSSNRISYVGISYYNLGQQYAEQIVSIGKMKNEIASQGYDTTVSDTFNVLVLGNDKIGENFRAVIYSAIRENLEERRDNRFRISMNSMIISGEGPFETEETIRSLFLPQNDLPDIFVCLDENSSACVYQAIVDYNQVGNTELAAFYTGDIVLSGISKDIIASTLGIDTYCLGKDGVEALLDFINTGYCSDYYSVDTYVVNKSNIEDYMKGGIDE